MTSRRVDAAAKRFCTPQSLTPIPLPPMFWTRTLIPTMKETPEGAEIPSHVLMLRAGLVNQVMAGAYTYLPLGLRALRKAERIVREEMDAAGAVELAMPAMSPRGLWEQTGRVAAFGDVLVQLTLHRPNRKVHVVLGPTHEEIVTELVSRQINSYRQMPITLYQITTKFRNEERPRFGVLRTSEFLMKDAYSFNASLESLDELRADVRRVLPDLLPLRARLSGRGGRERADRRRRQPRVHDSGRQRRGYRAALPIVRLRGQPGKGRDRPRDCTPPEVPLAPLATGGHAGRQHDRTGEPVPRSASRRT